jgi:streptogramin lyase
MRTLQRLFLCLICLATSLAAQQWRVNTTKITDAVQDSTGQVWGAAYSEDLGLYRWEDNTWKSVAVSGVPGSSALALARGPEGAVYCLWSAGAETHAVTWHKGTTSKLVTSFTGHLEDRPFVFVDPNRNVWLTERGRHIFRITPQGTAECVYTIADYQFHEYGRPVNDQSTINPVFATADARGRIWFWSDCLAWGTNVAALEGVLIFDGTKFEHHAYIAGVPDKKFSIVAPDDAGHMWLAVVDDQLYRVDIDNLTATPVPGPEPKAFRNVQKIFHADQETYLVSGTVWQPVPERTGYGRSGALWLRKEGKWEKLVNGLDMRPEHALHPFRPFLPSERGLWLGAFGVGPWFIPGGQGKPVLIDWHYADPLDGSEGLCQLPDGRLLIVSANQGSLAVKPADLLAASQAIPEISTLNPIRPFIQDARGHILGILATGTNALSDWDGKTWTDHALPSGFDPEHFWTFAADSMNRIWLLPDAWGKSVAIFNPEHETFEIYPGYSEALLAQGAGREKFHLDTALFTVPSFTPDGRICYRDEWDRVRYFNGRNWLRWERKQIDAHSSLGLDGPAFFDRAGNVAVNIEGKTWEFTEAEGWHKTNFEHGLGTDVERLSLPAPTPPPGCEISHPESIVRDRMGTYWLTNRGQLYRAIPGLCLPQFSPQEHQPFIDSRTVKEVLSDLQGNVFLETSFLGNPPIREYVVLKARPPLPQTKLHATVEARGMVKLRFATQVKGKAWFTWRIDGGDWSPPTRATEATANWLAQGKHTIAAAALDERLQIDPNPPVAEVTIRVDTQAQIAALIEQLKDPNYSIRDAAVAALARQPTLALPLLQSAREKAGADQRWWIDAAIQQIKDRMAKDKQQ